MLKRNPSQSLRKILYLQIENLPVRVAQEQYSAWNSAPCIITDKRKNETIYALSPAAKRIGITTKMTRTEAMHCCPHIESIQPIHKPSTSLQERILELLYEYTDLIEKISDTAFYMDITFDKLEIPIGFRTAQLVHSQLRNELELDAVVGLGPNKLLALLASKTCTKGPIHAVDKNDTAAFLANLPIDLLPGLGRTSRERLQTLGIERVGQLAGMDLSGLRQHVGRSALRLHQYAQGIDNAPVTPKIKVDSLSATIRFPTPLYDDEEIFTNIRQPVNTLVAKMRRRQLRSRLIAVRVSSGQGSTEHVEYPLSHYTDSSQTLLTALFDSLQHLRLSDHGVRELHIEMQQFNDKHAQQLDLFET